MSRGLRPIDPAASPEAAFAAELRKVYEAAGSPKFLQMARRTGKSRTALSEAVGGDHLPTWETTAAFLTACGVNGDEWRARWEDARDRARGRQRTVSVAADAPGSRPGALSAPEPRRGPVRVALPYLLVAVTSAAGSAAIAVRTGSGQRPAPVAAPVPPAATDRAVITVQNKVALGAAELVEDATPAYLSVKPSPYCANKDCKVDGTEMGTGAMIVATCQAHGDEMFNYNLDSSESKTNPHRVRSTRWYRAVFPDGRTGFISEVYLTPQTRGGLGLPPCP